MGLHSKKHILSFLLLVEAAAVGLFAGRLMSFRLFNGCEMVLLVICIRACEAAVGLGVLIALARVKGNDFVDRNMRIKV